MPPPNTKNFGLSMSATDLGLGDLVHQQLDDVEEERKKKMLKGAAQNPMLSPASISLLGNPSGAYG